MSYSQHKNKASAVHPLKGLLMDKGVEGLHANIRAVLQRMYQVSSAMEDLMVKQRANREAAGSHCIELYVAVQMRSRDEALQEVLDALPPGVLPPNYNGKHMMLEWRARHQFSAAYGYGLSARIQAFKPGHEHSTAVYEFVHARTPEFFPVLAGCDILRLTLNNAMKSLRKTLLDLAEASQITRYPDEYQRDARKFAERIFTTLPQPQELNLTLGRLYADLDAVDWV